MNHISPLFHAIIQLFEKKNTRLKSIKILTTKISRKIFMSDKTHIVFSDVISWILTYQPDFTRYHGYKGWIISVLSLSYEIFGLFLRFTSFIWIITCKCIRIVVRDRKEFLVSEILSKICYKCAREKHFKFLVRDS